MCNCKKSGGRLKKVQPKKHIVPNNNDAKQNG